MLAMHEWLAVKLHQIEMSSHFNKVSLQGGEPPGAIETEFRCAPCWEQPAIPRLCPLRQESPWIHAVAKLARPVAERVPLVGTRGQKILCGHLGRTHTPTLD